jgi:hypothetical protein
MVMDAKTLEALKGSIKKWEGIVKGEIMDNGIDNCPLCELYFGGYECQPCPVYLKTKRIDCDETPYMDWVAFWDGKSVDKTANCPESRRLAQAEVDFLKSLLPKQV